MIAKSNPEYKKLKDVEYINLDKKKEDDLIKKEEVKK